MSCGRDGSFLLVLGHTIKHAAGTIKAKAGVLLSPAAAQESVSKFKMFSVFIFPSGSVC